MPKRLSRPKRPKDINQLAHELVRRSTEEVEAPIPAVDISRVMREMGRKGGKIGGKKSRANMTPDQRREAASVAAKVRWAKKKSAED